MRDEASHEDDLELAMRYAAWALYTPKRKAASVNLNDALDAPLTSISRSVRRRMALR